MNIKDEFNQINLELTENKNDICNRINEKISLTQTQIENKLKKENIVVKVKLNIIPIINKFYQKLININNFVEKNLLFNIKNEPEDMMFLQKNIISINIESKNVEIKEEIKGMFELLLYNLTVQFKLDAYLYKNVKQIITEEENKLIPEINKILNDVLNNNKNKIIKKYNEIMLYKSKENPNKYEINTSFLSKYAQKYLIKISNEMLINLKSKSEKKLNEEIDSLKESILEKNKIKKNDLNKIILPLQTYIELFINTLFNKLNEITISTTEIIYSNNLKKDLEKYNNYVNKILDKEIILDKEFKNIKKKLFSNKKIKKDAENIKMLDRALEEIKNNIISNIKITIMDLLKTNSFNINKTITCTNFIKYSTKDQIEELNEKELIQMFELLIKNE